MNLKISKIRKKVLKFSYLAYFKEIIFVFPMLQIIYPLSTDSVARRGWKPPMWLFLASPGGENFAGLETAQTRSCGSFWTFLIFTNKITKFRDFWKKIQLFSPIFYLGFSFLKICASLFFPIFAVKLIDGHSIKHLKS